MKKETAEQFVKRILTGLTAKTLLPDYPNSIFYVNSESELIVEIEKETAWCRCAGFMSVLRKQYKLKYDEAQKLVKPILENALKIKGVTPKVESPAYARIVEKELKNKVEKPKPIRSTPVNRQVVKDLKKEVKKTKQLLKRVKKVKCKIDIDSKRIKKFLSETTGANYQFLSAMMDVRNGINNIITNYKLSKEEVCERFGVNKRKYNDFIHGNYEYDLKIMAVINDTFCEYESKKLGENAPFQTPKTEGK